MDKILAIKKYHFELDISLDEFKTRFTQSLIKNPSNSIKQFKGSLQDNTFTIKTQNRAFDFSTDDRMMFAIFFELVGKASKINSGTFVDLKLRVKPLTQVYWLLGYLFLGFVIFPVHSIFEVLIIPLVALINYAIMKVGIAISASFFMDRFKEIYNLKNDTIQDLNLKIEEKNNLIIIRTEKGTRILNNIMLPFFGSLFLLAIYSHTEITQFLIFVPLTIFIFLTFHQYYLSYKLKELRTSSEIVDFWLFYKLAKIPVPSLAFKKKNAERDDLESARQIYNALTGLMYACLLISLILTIYEIGIN